MVCLNVCIDSDNEEFAEKFFELDDGRIGCVPASETILFDFSSPFSATFPENINPEDICIRDEKRKCYVPFMDVVMWGFYHEDLHIIVYRVIEKERDLELAKDPENYTEWVKFGVEHNRMHKVFIDSEQMTSALRELLEERLFRTD